MTGVASERIERLQTLINPIFRYVTQSSYPRKVGQTGVADFAFGDPNEMPLRAFSAALKRWSDLEPLSVDVPRLQNKRDRLVGELRRMGYEVRSPEGAFYLLPRSPIADDWAFTEALAEEGVLCLPGEVVEMPGYFRISLTANETMIEGALPGFANVLEAWAKPAKVR